MARPQISDPTAWRQAEILMQPVFIRLIDNIRKELERSPWEGSYQEEVVWPEEIPGELRERIETLQAQLKTAAPEEANGLEEALSSLPQPMPGYFLCLEKEGSNAVTVDLWQVCYQICFKNYHPLLSQGENVAVEVDTSLLDEAGDVDWNRLDEKAQRIVQDIFASLSAA
ncbi:hypothetical protein [Vacuolonema iberomarrocanum]|uniref:hypothetical protein n=1 Tax=Vacuolonema iberomarrocanum TaxID=3454632 RepID=UPI001A0FC685|nr:hypothetical protein [filamentous cyanobacterium LEGE 07170]